MSVGAAIVTGGASLVTSAYQDYRNRKATGRANEFSERMASTVHQREVADLRKAGLNPILSGMGGKGAPSPSATAPIPTTDKINSALSAARLRSEIDNIDSQTAINRQNIKIKEPISDIGEAVGTITEDANSAVTESKNALQGIPNNIIDIWNTLPNYIKRKYQQMLRRRNQPIKNPKIKTMKKYPKERK